MKIQARTLSKMYPIGVWKRTENLPQSDAKGFKAANQIKWLYNWSKIHIVKSGRHLLVWKDGIDSPTNSTRSLSGSTVLDGIVYTIPFLVILVNRGPFGSLNAQLIFCPFNGPLQTAALNSLKTYHIFWSHYPLQPGPMFIYLYLYLIL